MSICCAMSAALVGADVPDFGPDFNPSTAVRKITIACIYIHPF